MVKLRSGTIYINKLGYNLIANKFNTFIEDLNKIYSSFESLPKIEIKQDIENIMNINEFVKVHKGSKGAYFFIKNVFVKCI